MFYLREYYLLLVAVIILTNWGKSNFPTCFCQENHFYVLCHTSTMMNAVTANTMEEATNMLGKSKV